MGWYQVDIGFVLNVGTATALIFRLPAGTLVDAIHLKRFAITTPLVMLGVSALTVVVEPTRPASFIRSPAACWPWRSRRLLCSFVAMTVSVSGRASTGAMLH